MMKRPKTKPAKKKPAKKKKFPSIGSTIDAIRARKKRNQDALNGKFSKTKVKKRKTKTA